MNKKQYEETFDRLDKYVFSRDMAVKDDWYYLLNYHQAQLQAYKDKYSDLETDYAKSVENEKTLRYTINKYYNEIQSYKSKEDKLREKVKAEYELSEDAFITHNDGCSIRHKAEYINGYKDMCEYMLQILNEGGK